MSSEKVVKVLYVDDEAVNLLAFNATFRRYFNVFTAISAKNAEDILDKVKDIHVLITDQRMPGKLGTELLADSVKKYPNQTRILLTAHVDNEAIKDAETRGQIYAYMLKPWDADLLKEYIIEGHDIFYRNMIQQQQKVKLSKLDKELNKIKKKKKTQNNRRKKK